MDMHPENAWVAARLAALTPTWNPNPARARAAIDRATAPRRRAPAYRLAAAAAGALLAAVLLAPSGRAIAQELWYRLFVTRVSGGAARSVAGAARDDDQHQRRRTVEPRPSPEAAAMAGSRRSCRRPPCSPARAGPERVQPHRADADDPTATRFAPALAAAGADDIDVPAEWDGVTAARDVIGRTVVARYLGRTGSGRRPDDVTILQTPPIRLDIPAGFPLDRFAEAVFRAGGLSWWEARTLGEEYAAHPAWLLDVPDGRAGHGRDDRHWRAGRRRHRRGRGRSAAPRYRDPCSVSRPWRLVRGEQPQPRTQAVAGGAAALRADRAGRIMPVPCTIPPAACRRPLGRRRPRCSSR